VSRVLLGDLVAEQRLEVVLRLKFGYGSVGTRVGILVGATDREGALAAAGLAPVPVGWEYDDDRANDAQPRDRSVDRKVAELFAARARQGAVTLNRLGDFERAVHHLRDVARKIESYAGSDAELCAIAKALRAEETEWSAPATEMRRKASFASASYSMRSRGPEGRAGA
jgi:hypothetical protein